MVFSVNFDKIKILLTSKHPLLQTEISRIFPHSLTDYTLKVYPDGETIPHIKESLENKNLFLIHFFDQPLLDSLMKLFMLIHAVKNRKPEQICIILPYLPYSRQNQKEYAPSAIELIARFLESAGANSIMTFDLHTPQHISYFKIPLYHLSFEKIIAADCHQRQLANFVIVSPDTGGIPRAKSLADQLKVTLISLSKRRNSPGDSEVLGIKGNVKGKHCVIFDDIVDSGNTLCSAAKALLDQGAISCEAYVTHSLLSVEAAKCIQNSHLKQLTTADTRLSLINDQPNIRMLSINQEIYRFITEFKG